MSAVVPSNHRHRNVAIAGGVVVFHLAALWALQTGLLRRTVEMIVPVTVLSEIVPPEPKIEPPAPQPPVPPPPRPRVEPVHKVTPKPPTPQPVARPDSAPAPNAPLGVATPQPPAPPIAAPAEPAPAPAPAAPAKVELPSTDADYLQNPKPAYPPISRRLREQGKVVVRVLIGTDGTAQHAQVVESSGYDRLDQAAVSTVLKWRFTPGKRGGVPVAMPYNVPINFVLE